MSDRHIFKIAVLSHDEPLHARLQNIFGVDFESSYTETSGSAFAYSHFNVEDQRLTAQLWMLDPSPQWSSIRNLYLKGSSGIVMLFDLSLKNAVAMNNRLLREFVSANRFPVPIILIDVGDSPNEDMEEVSKDIQRWTGFQVFWFHIGNEGDRIEHAFAEFMGKVRDWRAKNVIFQTLKVYFSIDAITSERRSIGKIIQQLRRIFTSHYYELLADQQLHDIIKQAILIEGFQFDENENCVVYEKNVKSSPWEEYEALLKQKPTVEKID